MTLPSVLLLSGGVGGAKLALGLDRMLPPGALAMLVNTADDFEHWGLRICPDLDTALYTLGGLVDTEQGWGRAEESWNVLDEMRRRGNDSWFKLGDKDLALHLERTWRLDAGETLTEISADFAARYGLSTRLLPMSDDPVATELETADGLLPFQRYFVQQRCEPAVRAVHYRGLTQAKVSPALLQLLVANSLRAIIIAPSNPVLSIAPILAVPGLRPLLRAAQIPIIAVSPLIGGRAVKGPTSKLMTELGMSSSVQGIASFYAEFVDAFVIDRQDERSAAELAVPIALTDTLMLTLEDRVRVAEAALSLAQRLSTSDYRRSV